MNYKTLIKKLNFDFKKTESANVDQDIQKEYNRQREHLEKTVNSLKYKLSKDSEIHKADNIRIMQVISIILKISSTSGKFIFQIGKCNFDKRSK